MKLLWYAHRDSCSEDGDEPDADDQWEEVRKNPDFLELLFLQTLYCGSS